MGLIQDLQGRKLTGCGGCDAIRSTLYKGMDLWLPKGAASTHDSFNSSSLGAFSESALKARGGGAPGVFIHNRLVFAGGASTWTAVILQHGDTTSVWGGASDVLRYYESGTAYPLTFLSINLDSEVFSTDTDTGSEIHTDCAASSVSTPDGFTKIVFSTTGGPNLEIPFNDPWIVTSGGNTSTYGPFSGDPIVDMDPMTLCREVENVPLNNWEVHWNG